ncbi:CRISPR-associated endonuclease Cas6f/Csy4 [bioreactor metagenome]|uniref:CRISPR-associated endonuclease Cas6f/Csy4 n=1 Tax=bioreactor metagenome TaxID=1076179 RepID=A0A644XHN8_9ZZZZ
MTTHYIDITLQPDPEFSQPQLMGALVSKLHRALVQLGSSDIGISFPAHVNTPMTKRTLGSKLRLHGPQAALENLAATDWLKGMRDHVTVLTVSAAPANAPHRTVERRQFKTSADRLRRRRMQRKGETAEQAAQAIPDTVERTPHLPYAQLRSSSTGQPFCLFIEHGATQTTAQPGAFNTYGLSSGATVPWF